MTDLQIIANIVTKYGAKKIDIIDPHQLEKATGRLFVDAYHGLADGVTPDYKRDGKRVDRPKDSYLGYKRGSDAFRQFSSRFTEKLMNLLFHLDISKSSLSKARKAEYKCSKMQHQLRALSMLYGRKPAIKLAHKILNMAMKYEMAEFVMYSAAYLRTVAAESGEKLLFEKYSKIYEYWTERREVENKARTLLETIIVEYGKSIDQKPELSHVAFQYASVIEKDITKHDCYVLQYHKRKLEALGHQIGYHYRQSIEAWDGLKTYLDHNADFASDIRYAEIALQQLDCYLHLRQYLEGNRCAETCLKYFVHGSSDRLVFMEYHYLLAMQSGEYVKGRQILAEVYKEMPLEKMPGPLREKWTLFETYSIYVGSNKKEIKAFNVPRFISEMHEFSKDKRGYNVSILIIQWCMLLRKKDFEGLYKISGALKEYRLRNLKGRHDYRLNLFVSMMQKSESLNYNKIAVQKATSTSVIKMNAAPMSYTANMEGLEVIPLDLLWKMALGDMK